MRHILLFSNSCLISKYKILTCIVMLGPISPLLFTVRNYTSSRLLLMRNPNGFIVVRMGCRSRGCNPRGLCFCHFPIIFDLDGEQEVTSIFVSKGTIVLMIIFQLTLNGWGEYVLDLKSYFTGCKLLVVEGPISCLGALALHQRWREVLI